MPDLDATATTTATDVTATPAAADTTQVTATPAPSTEEPKELEVVHEGAPVNGSQIIEDDTTDIKPADAESAREGDDKANEDTEVETKPRESEKKRGAEARIRQLATENNRLRQQIADAVKAKHPAIDVEKMIADGVDENTARLDGLEAERVTDQYIAKVTELNTTVNQETIEVARDFPYMDSDRTDRSPEEIKKAETITDLWFQAAHVEMAKDDKGNNYLTRADVSLYDFVKQIDDFASISAQASEVQGQRNAEKHLSAVEIPTGPAPRQNKAEDATLSAAEYAKKYNLPVVGG